MEWSKDFESGLVDIDAQHRMMYALVQRVERLAGADDSQALLLVVAEVLRFARAHFGCEEQLMNVYEYPGAAQHRTEHEMLQHDVETLMRSQNLTPREIALLICRWLMSHTLMEDRRLARHVLEIRAKALGISVEQLVADTHERWS